MSSIDVKRSTKYVFSTTAIQLMTWGYLQIRPYTWCQTGKILFNYL